MLDHHTPNSYEFQKWYCFGLNPPIEVRCWHIYIAGQISGMFGDKKKVTRRSHKEIQGGRDNFLNIDISGMP